MKKKLITCVLFFTLCLIKTNSFGQSVTVFEDPNFQGRSKSFTVGDYRLEKSVDFPFGISSIKIPDGLGVVIYEHSNLLSGYGISADLLEDHAILTDLKFNEKIPFISVFSTINPGFFWKRNSLNGDNFIAGHWEKNRANGNPTQSFAVVSPALPAKSVNENIGIDGVKTTLTIPDTPSRYRPNASESEIGLSPLIIDAPGINSTLSTEVITLFKKGKLEGIEAVPGTDNLNVNRLAPQHRSVGETTAQTLPSKSYEILEGIVTESDCQVANSDFPTEHYTHDIEFNVMPKPEFNFLLALNSDNPQKEIAVEWETGLGSCDLKANPAVQPNIVGQSFGFCSEGHHKKDVIWNWASPGDSVHIEGIWIWERGHPPSHTEIHPPHFMAIKRHLPVSFTPGVNGFGGIIISNLPTDKFFGTRIDITASADGSTMWNTKKLESFAQVVDMDRKDYVFTFSSLFSKPTPTAHLAWEIKYQVGNNFIVPLDIKEISSGVLQITVPWKTQHIANDIKLMCSIVAYWDVESMKGVTANEKPMLFDVAIQKIRIIDNGDFDKIPGKFITTDEGECILYANIGNEWICLNEFVGIGSQTNILTHGLGNTNDNENWTVKSKIFHVYVLKGDKFRIESTGWERDFSDSQMGDLISQYDRNKDDLKVALSKIFNSGGIRDGLVEDDPMGETNRSYLANDFSQNMIRKERAPTPSSDSGSGSFEFDYSVKRVN